MEYTEREPIEQRDELVKQNILRCNTRGNLKIYTYRNWCKEWNSITLNSRGIIYNCKTEEVVAQPFKKFFNMNQRDETQESNLPWNDNFRIFKKEDGWLGILYRYGGHYYIATNGSFSSVGAIWATKFLKRFKLHGLPNNVTLLFEIICPATHIVVDYGNREDLILLAAYNRNTGEEYSWEYVERWSKEFGFTLVESFHKGWLGYCKEQIKSIPGNSLEGFVIRFDNGLRVKIKSEDYFRRFRLLLCLAPLNIWSTMINGKVPDATFEQTDKTYHTYLRDVADILERNYDTVKRDILEQFNKIKHHLHRLTFAHFAKQTDNKNAMFMLLDNADSRLDKYIMKKIRPNNNII